MSSNCVLPTTPTMETPPFQLEWKAGVRSGLAFISTSSFSVTHQAGVTDEMYTAGRPIRYRQTGAWRYGIITSYAAGTVVISGASLVDLPGLTELQYGPTQKVLQINFAVGGNFAAVATNQIIEDYLNTYFRWGMATSYCVRISTRVTQIDTGGLQPNVNFRIAGSNVGSANAGAGLDVALTWVDTVVDLTVANMEVSFDDAIEITTDASGGNNDASDLTLVATFVMV